MTIKAVLGMANRLLTMAEVAELLKPAAAYLDELFTIYCAEHPGEECSIEMDPFFHQIKFVHAPLQGGFGG
jgi:hypothetical protein